MRNPTVHRKSFPVGLLIAALLLAGSLPAAGASPYTVVSSDHGKAEIVSTGTGRPLSSYLHDISEPIPGVTTANAILSHDRIPVPDGKLLDAWVLRPNIPDRVPVVLEVTPYYGGGDPMDPTNVLAGNFQLVAGQFVPRGYAVAIASVRGTGNSEGCFTIGGPDEAKDHAAVVQYYAGQPWSNGSVAMMGVSYPGTTPQDAWVEAPPGLKTIVPIEGISDLYKYNFVNGVHIDPQGYAFNTYYWALTGLGPVGLNGGNQLRDPVNVPGAVVGEVCPEQFWVQEGQLSSAVDGNKDGYWQLRDFLAELRQSPGKSRASVFYVHGFQDWNVQPHNVEGWLPAVIATGVPYHVWLGQWDHNYPDRPDWWTTVTAWFDQFLKGRDTGILDAPPVQVKDDDGRWRHEKEWPPRQVKRLTLYPRPDGTLGSTPQAGSATYNDYNGLQPGLPSPPLPLTPEQVVFVSAPLVEDLHLSGLPRFEGDVTASGDRASLILTLAERTPAGDRAINYAAISLNHVRDLSYGDPSIAGRTQRVGVNFFPQEDVIHAGNRIVLIASGNVVKAGGQPGPDLRPLSSGSEITLDLGEAKLILPLDRTLTYE
jgi:X-Pro dipeptidyl-peptidase